MARAYCGLTGLNGIQVLRELRADSETAGMKVIMTSGSVRIPEIASREGARDYMMYPVNQRDFARKVDAALRPG